MALEGGDGVADARDILLHLAWKGCPENCPDDNFVYLVNPYTVIAQLKQSVLGRQRLRGLAHPVGVIVTP